jgi:RHS repeat-associated protein
MSRNENRLLANENDGSLCFYHLDRLGSPVVITNKSGNVVKQKQYEAFGNLVWATGTYSDNREFTGKEKDLTGFHYFGARYYSGDIGRFLSPDPHTLMPENLKLENPQELSPYVYCVNNPLRYIDPLGLYMVLIGEDHEKDLKDLQLMAGDDASRLSYDEEGNLSINEEGYKGGNEGLDWLIKMDKSEKTFGYGCDQSGISGELDINGKVTQSVIKSASITHRWAGMGEKEQTMPFGDKIQREGFHGEVTISDQVIMEVRKCEYF